MKVGWRTVILGIAVAGVPAELQYIQGIDWTIIVPKVYVPLVTGVIGALIIWFRSFTSSPIFTAPPPPAPTEEKPK